MLRFYDFSISGPMIASIVRSGCTTSNRVHHQAMQAAYNGQTRIIHPGSVAVPPLLAQRLGGASPKAGDLPG